MTGCDAQLVLRALRDYFQPETFDRIFTQMDRFTSYTRTEQPIEKFLMEFGILRQKAAKLMFPTGCRFEDLFICFQCTKAARLTFEDGALLMAQRQDTFDGQPRRVGGFRQNEATASPIISPTQFGDQGGHFPGDGGEVCVARGGPIV